jgi:2',3'-cyclic-nucleotide 2'-phosphodiesterase (5'-nucleotidase family)/DNA/RNA endonuclease YhcR with UshA esterase domain
MSKILNLLICLLQASASWAQTTMHQWTFDSVSTSVGTTRPSVGNGSVSLLGGTTATFATGATAGGAGWNTSTYAAQFTASGTRGIEVVAPTTGFQNIQVTFKHRASGTASRWARVDYSLNGGAQWMTGFWNNNGGLSPHDVFYTFNVDFGTITGAANNANFRFRIVSVFSPLAFNESSAASFGADTAYMRANAAATYPPTPGGTVSAYSGNGTWRFDDLVVTGTAIPAAPAYTLQILHASDLEAGLLAPADAPRFASLVDTLSKTHPNTVILSSGDNVIPSPFLSASEDPSMQTPLRTAASSYYTGTQAVRAAIGRTDIMMMNLMKFNAACFGNHEFDLGTSELNGMIGVDIRSNGADKRWLGANFPYLSANLNFSGDANLSYLVTADGQSDTAFRTSPTITANSQKKGIARSVVIERGGEKIGVVGATTQILASISSPGATTMVGPSVNDMPALAAILQPVIDSLRIGQGINKIVLLTHLQQLSLEQALAPLLRGVDVLISGGNHSVLADNNDILRPGDVAVGTYPMIYRSADNEPILLVNTGAEYSYLGRLQVPFSSTGVVDTNALNSQINGAYATDSAGVARVWGSTAAAFANSNGMGARVKALCDAIQAVIVAKDGNLFGKSSVFLEGRRNFVRTEETNLGNVTADANLWMARKLDPAVAISIKNGGGVRSAMGEVYAVGSQVTLLPTSPNALANKQRGDISQLDIENSLRFNNRLSVLTIPVSGIKALLEHGISAWTTTATPGQFPQVSGVRFSFDPALASGSKIKNAALVDSAGNILDTLVYNGAVYGNAARTYRVVTLNFLAGGGDSYPFAPYASTRVDLDTALASLPAGAATFTVTGSEQDAFAEYMASRFPASSPYNIAETPATADTRIQNLSLRSDGVLPLGPNSLRSIASIRGVNATTGVLDSLGVRVRVSGTVYGVNQYSSSSTPIGIQFVMMDATGGTMLRKAGTTFGLDSLNANGRLAEGDSVEVYGILEQFNGLTQINCDTVIRLATSRPLRNPVTVTALGESTENELVRLNNLSIVSGTWPAAGVSSNINVTNGTTTFQMRIIAATDIDGTPAPTGPFDLVGLGGQFDGSNPFTSGYQIFPRRLSDILPVVVQNPTASFTRGDTVLANATTSVTIPIQVLNPSSTAQVLKVRVSATPGAVYGTTFETFPAPVGDSITLNLAPNAASASISCLLYNLVAPGRTDTISFDLFAASAGMTIGTVNRSMVRVFAPAIRTLTIAQIRGNDNGGLPDSLGVYARTTGIVMGFNKRPGGLEFTIFDPASNRGLGLFRATNVTPSYNVREGDLIRVIGSVAHFNGLAQINLDSLVLLDSNQTLPAVEVVTALNEYTESRLVRINNLTLVNPSQWPVPGTGGSGRTVQVTNGTATYDLRIDNDVNLYGTAAPVGPFDLVGLGGQFAPSPPHTTGYQLLPRYSQDLIQVSYGQITGTLTYNNTANTPMTNSTVRVLNAQNAVVRSAATNASGAFTLDSVPHGSYTLSGSTNKPWGGVTATDALGVTRHVTGVLPLAGLRVGAADVNGSATVTSSDALLVNRRFSGSITSFSVGNWISENPAVAVSNTPASQNLKMLAYGDVNGSYVPSTSQRLEATLQLQEGTEQGVVRDGLVRLALRADRAMELGAISLELPLPAGLEVVGMEAGSAMGYSSWGRRDGMTCYGWFAEQGLRVSENDVLLTLVIKADQMNMLEGLNWNNVSLGSLSEMVNPWGEVISGSLRVDRAIKAVHNVQMFPNPAQNRVNWTWNSAQGAPSSLIVRDYTGRVVASMLPTQGSTQASLDLGQIPAGAYTVEMVWTGSNGAEHSERANLVVRP